MTNLLGAGHCRVASAATSAAVVQGKRGARRLATPGRGGAILEPFEFEQVAISDPRLRRAGVRGTGDRVVDRLDQMVEGELGPRRPA